MRRTAPTSSARRRRRLGRVAALVTVAVAVVPTISSGLAGGASPKPSAKRVAAARAWYRQVTGDLAPLDTSLVQGLQAASQWQKGKESGASAGHAFAQNVTDLQVVLGNLQHQAPLEGEVGSLADFVAAVQLYLQAFALEGEATHLRPGKLVSQLQRSFERVRQLGDITYDEGTAELAPLLGSAIAGVDVRAARTIADWVSRNLAPGEPLESSWTGTQAQPSTTQSVSAWDAAVRADGAPSTSTVRALVARAASSASVSSALSHLALALQQTEVRLCRVPGPRGRPGASALLRLGFLVDAEAALAGEASQLAGISPDVALAAVGVSLASVGNRLRASATSTTG